MELTLSLSVAPGEVTFVDPRDRLISGSDGPDNKGSDDYEVPDLVDIGPEDTSVSFTFTAKDDTIDDDGESVRIRLIPMGVPGNFTIQDPDELMIAIIDNDVPPVSATFVQGSYTIAEGDGDTIRVTLSDDPEREVVIPLVVTNRGGATRRDDDHGRLLPGRADQSHVRGRSHRADDRVQRQ